MATQGEIQVNIDSIKLSIAALKQNRDGPKVEELIELLSEQVDLLEEAKELDTKLEELDAEGSEDEQEKIVAKMKEAQEKSHENQTRIRELFDSLDRVEQEVEEIDPL